MLFVAIGEIGLALAAVYGAYEGVVSAMEDAKNEILHQQIQHPQFFRAFVQRPDSLFCLLLMR